MKGNRRRPWFSVTIAAETLVIINDYTSESELSTGRALDRIVREWVESKEIDPLKTPPKASDLDHLHETLIYVNECANRIKHKLERMSL